ncbi:hypothetical protein C8F04DRAFT_1256768 [Mycena alexandri]|uniref:Uncharacterized protein n=1 Tax=Mycena alexandri TaxID=1745969 RepID=A0AAD6T0L5_9AGAR|nr:hypothetical protein C8F04DRAFT_1256768 [Mycena alexandri]
MPGIPRREINRLFGPIYRPADNTNVRHQAILRKALELRSLEQFADIFENDFTNLRLVMGTSLMFAQFGIVKHNYMRNFRRVSHETPPLSLEQRQHLDDYRKAYDKHHMAQGNDYDIRGQGDKAGMQAAEQTWHDRMVVHHAAHGRADRPAWALEPLPGLERVRVGGVAPVFAPAPAPTPRALLPRAPAPPFTPLRRAPFPALPSPPSSSRIIDLSHIDDEPARPARKRKFLGVLDISDEEEEEVARPRKKVKRRARFWHIDLTID